MPDGTLWLSTWVSFGRVTWSSRLGEPAPRPVRTSTVALSVSVLATWAGVRLGSASRSIAAAPATCGVAIEVPLIVFVAVLLVNQAEVIEEPGANTSRQEPMFEKEE